MQIVSNDGLIIASQNEYYTVNTNEQFISQKQENAKHNMMLVQAKAMLELAKQEVQNIQYSRLKNATVSVKNEVLEMIAKVAKRKGRLNLPIVSGNQRYSHCKRSMTVLVKRSQRLPQN